MDIPYPDEAHDPDTPLVRIESEIFSWFDEYVFNKIPTHLIYVPEMKLVHQSQIAQIVGFETLVHEFLASPEAKNASRDYIIEHLIKPVLKYAILSHRWLRQGEITYQDMVSPTCPSNSQDGPGYKKLEGFCGKAADYGCLFAWADTCCINKTSSTELHEAIQSMYNWYEGAEVCVVYLAGSDGVGDLFKDAWFTRGWTLQELLAPFTMKFYVRDWSPLTTAVNDKEDDRMVDRISKITLIPQSFIRHYQPGIDFIHKKMSWASRRRTTKTEDVAYSLLGIFDISIPVTYGEGERAFCRLMEAIVQRCRNLEVLAWAGPHSRYALSMTIPRSPRCYYLLDAELNFGANGDKEFSLTHNGLRIKLLLVEGTLHAVPHESPRRLRWFPVGFMGQQCDPVDIDTIISQEELEGNRWALGVVNYERQTPQLRSSQSYLSFLLRQSFGPREPWTKIDTCLAVILRTLDSYVHEHPTVAFVDLDI